MMGKKEKTILIAVGAVLLVLALVFAGIKLFGGPKTAAGQKTITVTVVTQEEAREFTVMTDAEFLRGALEQEGLVEGTESQMGLYVTAVGGIVADEANQEWWGFYKGGEMLLTGVDETPIADGDAFEVTLNVGY